MLLALLMATAILSLLFSGWLTPPTAKAQTGGGNPPPNNENTNCPNYTTNVASSCPAITNGEDLAPLTFCVELGNALPDPTWSSQPGATPGQVVTTITETCSNTVNSTTNPVTYSFSWHYQNPPGKPAKPTTAGTYSATAIGVISSSDTNDCPDPNAPTWGVTWTVIDSSIDAGSIAGNANNGGKTWSVDWRKGLSDIQNNTGLGNMFILSDPSATLYLNYNWWKQQICCQNGGSGKIDKEWYTGNATYGLNGQIDLTVLSAFPAWYQKIISVIASLDSNWAQDLANITGFGHLNVSGNVVVSGNTTIRNPFNDDCYGCYSAYATEESTFNASVNDSFNSSLCGGINLSLTGYFNSDLKDYGIAINPPDPANQINIFEQDKIKYSLYSYAKIGSWTPGGAYWIGPGSASIPDPAQVVNTPCTSPNL